LNDKLYIIVASNVCWLNDGGKYFWTDVTDILF